MKSILTLESGRTKPVHLLNFDDLDYTVDKIDSVFFLRKLARINAGRAIRTKSNLPIQVIGDTDRGLVIFENTNEAYYYPYKEAPYEKKQLKYNWNAQCKTCNEEQPSYEMPKKHNIKLCACSYFELKAILK